MRASTLLFLACLCIACGGGEPPLHPSELGAPAWAELTSTHFVVRTDLAAGKALELVNAFEHIHSAMEDIAFPYEVKPRGRTHVLVFRDEDEYEQFAPKGTRGFYRYLQDDPTVQSMIVLYGDISAATRSTFQHELAHRFVHFYFPGAPRWLSEGLAQYYSTMTVEGGKVVLGRDLPYLRLRPGLTWDAQADPTWEQIVAVPTGVLPAAQRVVESGPVDFSRRAVDVGLEGEDARRVTAFYAGAWALTHVLKNSSGAYPRMFDAFLLALSAGTEPHLAWSAAFRGVDFAALDRSLGAFYMRRDTTVLRAPYEPPRTARVERARKLAPAEVYLLRAAVRPWTDAQRDRVEADLDAAVKLAPQSPDVHVWRARFFRLAGRHESASNELWQALDVRPGDEQALLELLRVREAQAAREPTATRSEQVEAAVRELLPRATAAVTLSSLASYLARRDRVDEALPLAARAVEADFNCVECYETFAFVLHAKGRLAEAYRMQSVAVGLLPDGISSAGMLERLEQYRADAVAGKGAAAASTKTTPSVAVPSSTCPDTSKDAALPKEAIRRVVRGRMDSLRFCLARNPGARGRVLVNFSIAPSGAVCHVEIAESTLDDAQALDCIARTAATYVFPPPEGGGVLRVSYPFVFGAG